jgi:hypothetical protein
MVAVLLGFFALDPELMVYVSVLRWDFFKDYAIMSPRSRGLSGSREIWSMYSYGCSVVDGVFFA